MGKKTLIILALLSLAWTWPPEWNPHGKSSTFADGGNYRTVTDQRHSIVTKLYSDGYLVVYFFETETTVRPVLIDPNPECLCCKVLVDSGVSPEDSDGYLNPENWKESKWEWYAPKECGKDLNGTSVNIGF